MSDFSFKNNKQIEIIKEMVRTSSDRYEINGIELSKARFMWRKFQEAFQILSPGSYSIIQEAGNTFLKIDDTVLLGEAIEFQVIYVFDQESSQYIDDFPDVSILKEKYNELQRDFTNLNRLLKSNNITGDTLKMFYVLPELNEGEVWIRTKDGWKGTNVVDLDRIVQDLINKIETQIKPDLTIWIQNELAKIQNRIDELMVHDYIDIPFLNKDVVQIYIDTDTKTVRECDNTKFEPLSAVGLKFIKEDGTTVTRCYFRGVYDKPVTLNIQDGVYWQTHTSADGLTLIQPQKWKSQAFELSNGKMYFDRGNPILIQGELGTIVFKEYETLNQAKADSSLVNGDYVIVTGDTQANDGGQGVYQLVNGVFELRDFNRSFLGQKLDKQDAIEDLKKTTQYIVGDVVEVLGYYVKGDGGGHLRQKKPNGYVGEDSVIGADGSIWAIVQCGEVNASWFGARGDGMLDNSDIIQKLFDYSSKRTASDIKFNSGTYLCLKSVTIEETQQAELSYFKIEGTGYEHYDRGVNLRLNNETKILFRNLGHNRGGFEFLGKDNGWATSIQMRNIDLTATDNSNHKWSSAIKIGSSIASVFERCTFQGKNGANVISGIDPFTYAFINTAFRNCFFESDVASGFSIFNGVIFSNNTTYSPNDNAVYSECLFKGTAMFFSYQEKLVNCMHYCRTDRVEPNYVFTVEKDGVAPFFDGYTVNFKNNLYIGSSTSMSIQGTYFEDYENAIVIYPFKGALVDRLNIIGCHFSKFKNVQPDYPESTRQILIKEALRKEGAVESVYLSNNTFLGRALETVYSENKDVTVIEMFNYFKEGEPFKIDGVYNRLLSTEEGAFDSKEFVFDKVYINGYETTAYYSELNIQYLQAQRSSNIKYIEFATDKTLLGKTVNLVLTNGGVEFQWPVDTSSSLQIGSNFLYRLYPLPSYTNYKIKKDNLVSCGIYSADGNIETRGVISIVTGY